MIQTLFNTIVKMSAAGSLICLAVYLIKPITSRIFNATWHFYTKLIIILILLVPFPLCFTTFEINMPSEYPQFSDSAVSAFPNADYVKSGMDSPGLLVRQDTGQALSAFVKSLIDMSDSSMQYIWLCGVIVFFLLKLRSYFLIRKIMMKNIEIRNGKAFDMLKICKREMGIKRKIRLVCNNSVGTPMLIGLFRPTIIIPEVESQQNELRFIFTHELVHFKRGDLWIKASVLIVSVIHWFNPVSLLLVRDINRLCELSCDEAVIEKADFPSRKKYAETIIRMLDKRIEMSGTIYSAMNGNAENLKRRLNNMLNYKKPKKVRLIFSITVAVTICILAISASTAMIHPDDTSLANSKPDDSAVTGNSSTGQDNIIKEDEEISMGWPVPDSKTISAAYGKRIHPIYNKETLHTGIDIAGKNGAPIVAAESGNIITAEWRDDYGYYLIIKHSGGMTTLYSHCSKLLVKKGDEVTAGQNIAQIGSTGEATGPHLHFEVSKDGEIQNPMDYVIF